MYVKPTEKQSYLYSNTEKGIAYSQALRFNKIYYNRSDLHNNSKRLLNTLTKRCHNKPDTRQHKSTVQEMSY